MREKRTEAKRDGGVEKQTLDIHVELNKGVCDLRETAQAVEVQVGSHCFAWWHSVVPRLARFSEPSRAD